MTRWVLAVLAWALVIAAPALATDWNTNQLEIPGGSDTLRFKANPATGDIGLEANQCALATNGLVCEGATADAFEGRLLLPDVTGSDKAWSFPDASGVVVFDAATQTLTNKTIDDADNTLAVDGASITTGTIPPARLGADSVDAMSDIDTAIKTNDTDTKLLTTSAANPGSNKCLEINATGSVVQATAACGTGGGGGPATDLDCVGCVSDAELAGDYSGVGSCPTDTWARALNDNGAPTCTQPAFSNLSGAATAGQIPAAAADCGAGQFAKGIDAGLVLDCATPAGGSLAGLSDVTITAAASGDFLRHNGTAWVDATIVDGDVPTTLTSKTLVTPTIASLTNAQHNHQSAAGGGALTMNTATFGTNATSSGNLSSILSNETGSGFVVYHTSPTFNSTPVIGDGSANDKLEFAEESTDPTCAAGGYYIWANSTDGKLKKCENGTKADIGSGSVTTAELPIVPNTKGGTGQDTSATTGVPKVTAGTWAFDAGVANLSDVTITSPATGSVLKFDGSAWIDDTDLTGGSSADATLMAGRAGSGNDTMLSTDGTVNNGGTLYGTVTTGKDLNLRANAANTTTGVINLNAPKVSVWPSLGGSTIAGSLNAGMVEINQSYTISGGTPTIYGYRLGGTVTFSDTSADVLVYQFNWVRADPVLTSVNGAWIRYQDGFMSAPTIRYPGSTDMIDTTAAGNPWLPVDFLGFDTIETTSTGDYSIANTVGFWPRHFFRSADASSRLLHDRWTALYVTPPEKGNGSMAGEVDFIDWHGMLLDGAFAPSGVAHVYAGNRGCTGAGAPMTCCSGAGAGTCGEATTAYGIRLIDLNFGATNHTLYSNSTGASMVHAGKIGIGDTVAPAASLDIHGDGGQLRFDSDSVNTQSFIKFADGTETWNAGQLLISLTAGTYTINNTAAYLGGIAVGSLAGGTTLNYTAAGNPIFSSLMTLFAVAPTIKVSSGAPVSGVWSTPFISGITFTADAASTVMTITDDQDYASIPTFSTSAGGTFGAGSARRGYYSKPTVSSGTIDTYRGFVYADKTGAGTLTTQIGVDIAALSGGGTTNIGIRNADTYVATPAAAQAIAAATDDLACTAEFKKFTTATGTTVLTDNPIIADGVDGQVCILMNTDAVASDCVTFTDGQGLQLSGNYTMCPNDMLVLRYNGTDWIEQTRSKQDREACIALDNVTTAMLRRYWIAPTGGANITAVSCMYGDLDGSAACTSAPTVEWEDQAANVVTSSGITCTATTGTWTATTGALTSGEVLTLDVVTAGDTDCDVIACAQYSP